MSQTIKHDDTIRPTVIIYDGNHCPSWVVPHGPGSAGSAGLTVAITRSDWGLDICMEERGLKSGKLTMMHLDEKSGRALYEFLKRMYGNE